MSGSKSTFSFGSMRPSAPIVPAPVVSPPSEPVDLPPPEPAPLYPPPPSEPPKARTVVTFPPLAPPEVHQESPVMSILPALVAGARSEIVGAVTAVVSAFLKSRGQPGAEGLVDEIVEIVEDAIKTAGRLKRRSPPDLSDRLSQAAEIAFESLRGCLAERGQAEDDETLEVLTRILRHSIEAATSTGEDTGDDVRGPLGRLADMVGDLLEADPVKLEARAARAEERAQELRAQAARVRARKR